MVTRMVSIDGKLNLVYPYLLVILSITPSVLKRGHIRNVPVRETASHVVMKHH